MLLGAYIPLPPPLNCATWIVQPWCVYPAPGEGREREEDDWFMHHFLSLSVLLFHWLGDPFNQNLFLFYYIFTPKTSTWFQQHGGWLDFIHLFMKQHSTTSATHTRWWKQTAAKALYSVNNDDIKHWHLCHCTQRREAALSVKWLRC